MTQKLNHSNTIVIADFDGTLTKKVVDGQKVPSLISLLINETHLGAAGVEESKALFAKYYPIEQDHTISEAEKIAAMQQWWEETNDVLRRYQVSSKMIAEICQSPLMQFRDGLVDFLHFLNCNNVPLIIYSANGIGYDAIEYLLKHKQVLTPNISICSNDLLFDENGIFIDVKPPIIHSANKVGATLIQNGFIAQVPERRHCLLIGDSLDDVKMTSGIDFDTVTKVVFADESSPKFSELFDVVLPLDGGFQPISAMLE